MKSAKLVKKASTLLGYVREREHWNEEEERLQCCLVQGFAQSIKYTRTDNVISISTYNELIGQTASVTITMPKSARGTETPSIDTS
jgi:hypothetical protein